MRLLRGESSPKIESPQTFTPGDFFDAPQDAGVSRPSHPQIKSQFSPQSELGISVWVVDEKTCEPYDQFVKTHGHESLYHTLAWRSALLREGIGDPYYLMAMQGDDAVGILPLFSQIGPLGCRRLNSLPGTPDVGVLSLSPEIAATLVNRARILARKLGVSEITQRQFVRPNNGNIPNFGPKWLRVPADALISFAKSHYQEHTPPHSNTSNNHHHNTLIQASPMKDRDGIDAILLKLGALNVHPGHLADENGNAMAVWITKRDIAYVLGYRTLELPSDHLALMARIAKHVSASGARWMDFSLPKDPESWDHGLLSLDDTFISCETRLAINAN